MRTDIKAKLKDMDIKLVDFARELEISRPTLNNYIAAFENNETISSDKHRLVFEKLFNNGVDTNEKFQDVLAKYHHLLERDKVLGTLNFDVEKTDLITSIFEHMKNDVKEDDYDEDVYTFINMLVRSYKSVNTFKKFAKYFLFLNGVNDLEELKETDKPFISNCYKLMYGDMKDTLENDEIYFEKFLDKVAKIKADNEEKSEVKVEAIKNKMQERISEKLQEQIKLGLDPEDIDIEQILDSLGLKSNKKP